MHLGHARTYVWFDMMRRIVEFVTAARGAPPPLFVMNVTDVDDKILAAASTEMPPLSLSRQAEANFFKDMDRLGCLRPHMIPRVTEFVASDIVPYIERLVEQDMAYTSQDGVYFDVKAFEASVGESSFYGKLAGNRGHDDDEEETGDLTSKRDKRDFALWKLRKDGEDVHWPSPWGEGRPGWHIECSAMIEAVQKQFNETHKFLVHAGGLDLKFPHHTNEIAQAEAYHGCDCSSTKEWIPHWVHTGHLMVQHEKMSKSLKNFLTVDELWVDYDYASSSELDSPADDFRWWCLTGGAYGQRQEYSRSKMLAARQNREQILRFLLDGEDWMDRCNVEIAQSFENSTRLWSKADHALLTTASSAARDAHQALLSNMQGSQYAKKLNQMAEAGNGYIRQHDPSETANVEPIRVALKQVRHLLALVGFSDLTVNAGAKSSADKEEETAKSGASYVVGGERAVLDELVAFRALVRSAALQDVKDKKGTDNMMAIMKACDQLRDSLPALGVEVMDTKDDKGPRWRFCVPKGRKQ